MGGECLDVLGAGETLSRDMIEAGLGTVRTLRWLSARGLCSLAGSPDARGVVRVRLANGLFQTVRASDLSNVTRGMITTYLQDGVSRMSAEWVDNRVSLIMATGSGEQIAELVEVWRNLQVVVDDASGMYVRLPAQKLAE